MLPAPIELSLLPPEPPLLEELLEELPHPFNNRLVPCQQNHISRFQDTATNNVFIHKAEE